MRIKPVSVAEIIFLTFVFFLVNIRSTIFWSLYPPTDTFLAPAWRETVLWLLALLLMFYLVKKNDLVRGYLQAWRVQPLLIIFVLFSLASIFWSTAWTVTLHRSLVFLFATTAAVFLGVRYPIKDFLWVLCWVGGIVVLASFILALTMPKLGTDLGPFYNGSWRGVFWHRNHLGNILPILNLVFLLCFVSSVCGGMSSGKWLFAFFYVLSLFDIFFAKSASGYIVTIVLHLVFGAAFLWLRIRHLLRPWHYYSVLVAFFIVAACVFLNLDFIFGLFGRETHLTGRIPMWGILFREVFPLNPWLGQGFGTAWADLDFRLYMRDSAGWPYPIMIGDNGFIDILLNLGIIGFVLFLLYYIKAWINSTRYFLLEPSLEGFFPFIFMVYTFFANLTFSLFMETEVFVWSLMAVLVVIIMREERQITDK